MTILKYIAETTVYSLSNVCYAYQSNMEKYNTILDEREILQCMESFGLYGIDEIVALTNIGG